MPAPGPLGPMAITLRVGSQATGRCRGTALPSRPCGKDGSGEPSHRVKPPSGTDSKRTRRERKSINPDREEPIAMRARLLGALGPTLLSVLGVFSSRAEEGTLERAAPDQEKAVALVRQLGSEEYTVRQQAYQELARLGRTAEAALQRGLQDDA